MKIWLVTEACSYDDRGMDVSSFTKLAHSFEEASRLLKEMVEERVDENIVPCENYNDDDMYHEDRDLAIARIMDSEDGYGWYRYKDDQEAFGWNVSCQEFETEEKR